MRKDLYGVVYIITSVTVLGAILYCLPFLQGSPSERFILQIVLGIILILLFIQGIVIFRPLLLAHKNYEKTNIMFVELKQSEQSMRVRYEKQKTMNKKLLTSCQQLSIDVKNLKSSEVKFMRQAEDQTEVNEKLVQAHLQLEDAYSELHNLQEDIKTMAEQHLKDNEKLFMAEKQVQEALRQEKKRSEELDIAMENLKNTQSQLVHSEKMASLGQLTAGIAHEINNPINFISSGIKSIEFALEAMRKILTKYDQLENDTNRVVEILEDVRNLKEDHEYDEIMEDLDVMVRDVNYGVTRTIEIIKGLRVFSRLEEEEIKKTNINENLDATLILLRNQTKNHIKFLKFYDENMGEIECYPGQLNQVFMNIINNAIQAIPEEKKDGEIFIHTEEKSDHISIKIKDNGVGIPEELKSRIWEPFFTTKAVGVGTGLGMSISYSIIEKHHGKIQLNSNVNEGTEFSIMIPKVFLEDTRHDVVTAENT